MKLLLLSPLPIRRNHKLLNKAVDFKDTASDSDTASVTSSNLSSQFYTPPTKSALKTTQRKSVATKLRVTFEECENMYYDSEHKVPLADLWLSKQEIRHFKTKSKSQAKEVKQNASTLIFDAYDACCRVESETTSKRSKGPLTTQEQQNLAVWMQVHSDLIGLERSSVRYISKQKNSMRKRVVRAVLDCQLDCAVDILAERSTKKGGFDDEERIRQASLNNSRASRLFAQELGLAQAGSTSNKKSSAALLQEAVLRGSMFANTE